MVPYRPEARTETRIYQPGVGRHPNAKKAAWVGKPVTVRWRAPYLLYQGMEPNKKTGQAEFLWSMEWVGWVYEMNDWFPEADLKPLPKEKK
jgi:hypothetical protein